MISVNDYFGAKLTNQEVTELVKMNAMALLDRVNALLDEARNVGVYKDWVDPDTNTNISGTKGGSGDGGFRLANSTTGAVGSQHRKARAVDIFDPNNDLDLWISDATLNRYGLYREAPGATKTWCHLQSVPPMSGRRTFNP